MRIITHCKKIFLKLLKVWGMITLFLVPIWGLLMVYPNLIPHLNYIISQHWLICTVFRWCIVMGIYYIGSIYAQKLGQKGYWSLERIKHWTKTRNKLMVCFILFEFILMGERLTPIILNFWKS